jgi:hypothetical protein
MSCDDARPLLGEYLTGALVPEETAAAWSHLEACPSCRRELDELRALDRELGELLPVTRPGPRVAAWAAAAAAAVLLGVLGLRVFAAPAPRVGDGSVESAAGRLGRGDGIPYGVPLSSTQGAALELPDGSFVESGADARFTLIAPRTLRLDGGDAFFEVRRGGDLFRVLTPRGEVEVLGTSFVVRVGESSMKKAAGVAVSVAVLSGALLLRPSDPNVTPATVELRAGERAVMEVGALRKGTAAPLDRSTSGLEAAVRALEQQQILLESDISVLEGKENPYKGLHPQSYLQEMEDLFEDMIRHSSIDPAAAKKAKDTWMRIWKEILEAEKSSAKVIRNGNSVRIEIASLADRLEGWRKEWARAIRCFRPMKRSSTRLCSSTGQAPTPSRSSLGLTCRAWTSPSSRSRWGSRAAGPRGPCGNANSWAVISGSSI